MIEDRDLPGYGRFVEQALGNTMQLVSNDQIKPYRRGAGPGDVATLASQHKSQIPTI